MGDLDPDLDRLGHALTQATARAVTRRAHIADRRRRVVACVAAGLFVFAALTPSHLGPADQPEFLQIARADAAIMCDQPRGQRFHYNEACLEPRPPQPQAAR